MTFEILLYLNMFYTMFYAGIETFFFFMKYLYVPDFGKLLQKLTLERRLFVRSSMSTLSVAPNLYVSISELYS